MAAMYAVYHGPEGLKTIAQRAHGLAATFAAGLKKLGTVEVQDLPFFDTVKIKCADAKAIADAACKNEMNLRVVDSTTVDLAMLPTQLLGALPLHLDRHKLPPSAPTQSSSGGSMLGGPGGMVAQGLAFGTGSSIAHRVVDTIVGLRIVQREDVGAKTTAAPMANNVAGSDAFNIHNKAFTDCINSYGSDISKCQFYLDMLNECRRNSGSGMNV